MTRVWDSALIAVLLAAASAQAALKVVSLNLRSDRNDSALAAGETAGVVPRANWNNTAQIDSPFTETLTDLLDDTGAPTTIDVMWQAEAIWTADPLGEDQELPDKKMMLAYIYGPYGDPPSVTFSQIPFSFYDVYVYALTNVEGLVSGISIVETGITYWIRAPMAGTTGAPYMDGTMDPFPFVLGTSTDPNDPTGDANYVVFSNLSYSSFTVQGLLAEDFPYLGAPISAIQIVEVIPEPASAGLILLGAVTARCLSKLRAGRRSRFPREGSAEISEDRRALNLQKKSIDLIF